MSEEGIVRVLEKTVEANEASLRWAESQLRSLVVGIENIKESLRVDKKRLEELSDVPVSGGGYSPLDVLNGQLGFCPECASKLSTQEGCEVCSNCGYTRC